jgi:hypothetical protein
MAGKEPLETTFTTCSVIDFVCDDKPVAVGVWAVIAVRVGWEASITKDTNVCAAVGFVRGVEFTVDTGGLPGIEKVGQ